VRGHYSKSNSSLRTDAAQPQFKFVDPRTHSTHTYAI
jgi:hypothetical protein